MPPPEVRLCAIIPAYNEGRHIARVVRGVLELLPEVVVIDDGSGDDTAQRAESAGADVIRHPQNRGKGRALQTGFDYASRQGYDAVVALDADCQHDPAELPKFLSALSGRDGDIILGSRMENPVGMPWVRRWTNRITSFVLSRLAGQVITDSQSGYKAVTTEVLRQVRPSRAGFDAESEFLVQASWLGFRIAEVPIRTIYGQEVSSISPVLDTWRFLRLCLSFILRLGPGAGPFRPATGGPTR